MDSAKNTLPAEAPAHTSVQNEYDAVIVGGGLAGLALSIQLAKRGYKVIILEKEQYPFHKVCGEYISLESWDFLIELGLPLNRMNVSLISRLQISLTNGKTLDQQLPLGGFGISRFVLDYALAEIARSKGVIVEEDSKVTGIHFNSSSFTVEAQGKAYTAPVVCGSFGKRSNLDIRWKRPFISKKKGKLNNYIGVKYHVQVDFSPDTIALHYFPNGYCGIVKIEENKYCLCYLTTAANLARCNGSIKVMEQTILSQNPYLKKILTEHYKLFEQPVTISQISFDRKTQVEEHVLLAGDAAGMITPLCGNGMSMALHASKLAGQQIDLFLKGFISREEMEKQYSRLWQTNFSRRLKTGRIIQRMFDNKWLIHLLIYLGKKIPKLALYLVRQTHGKSF
ncbi:NAD(P)/FAD-dependent oxidoreductase [Terrimonas alba]|uniref:NAD(P)/FAD-dependent oxidoreductase n=1 Tax=Terrimonas alba TaxID=3349636 RepID=UPI0035F4186F